MPVDPAVDSAIRARLGSSEFAQWMGIEVVSFDLGRSELRLKVQPHHRNPGGIVHGGIVATMLDAAIGLALRTRLGLGTRHVTVHLDVQYLATIRGGTITARGECLHAGSRVEYGEGSLYDEHDRLAARGSATFLVVEGTWDDQRE